MRPRLIYALALPQSVSILAEWPIQWLVIAQLKMKTVVVGFTAPVSSIEVFSFLKTQRRGNQFFIFFGEEDDRNIRQRLVESIKCFGQIWIAPFTGRCSIKLPYRSHMFVGELITGEMIYGIHALLCSSSFRFNLFVFERNKASQSSNDLPLD